MNEIIFGLCAVISIICAVALFRGYLKERSCLLLWSSICFALLCVNNLVLFVDVVVFPEVDFQGPIIRNFLSATAGTVLVLGLVWELS